MVIGRSDRQPSLLGDLSKQCLADSSRWFGDQQDGMLVYNVPYLALCMAGEVGEFCNVVKKIERGSLDIRDAKVRHSLAMELTDVFVYLLNLAGALNVDLFKSYEIIRQQNEIRFTQQRKEREERVRAQSNGAPADTD